MKHFIAYTKILWRNEVKATSLCNVYILKIILYFLISKLVFPSTPCVLLKLIYDTRVRKKEDIAELKFSLEKREKKILSLKSRGEGWYFKDWGQEQREASGKMLVFWSPFSGMESERAEDCIGKLRAKGRFFTSCWELVAPGRWARWVGLSDRRCGAASLGSERTRKGVNRP